jgi:hypothetical protein
MKHQLIGGEIIMKKRLIICLLLCLAGLILVAGCSPKNNAQSSSATSTGNQVKSSTSSHQAATPDIFGQVKGVDGNDITIALAQLPQWNQNHSGKNSQNASQNPPSSTGKGQGQRGQWTLKLTGESKTITIPSGAKIYGGRGGYGGQQQGQSQGQGPKVITLNDIKAGDTISVYYKAGTTTVDHVSVRSGGQQQ